MIKIFSMRKGSERPDASFHCVRIDRQSPLGNPFRMGSESERDAVCDRYEEWFQVQVRKDGSAVRHAVVDLYRKHRDGKNIALMCWCAPKRCHGESIKRFIESF